MEQNSVIQDDPVSKMEELSTTIKELFGFDPELFKEITIQVIGIQDLEKQNDFLEKIIDIITKMKTFTDGDSTVKELSRMVSDYKVLPLNLKFSIAKSEMSESKLRFDNGAFSTGISFTLQATNYTICLLFKKNDDLIFYSYEQEVEGKTAHEIGHMIIDIDNWNGKEVDRKKLEQYVLNKKIEFLKYFCSKYSKEIKKIQSFATSFMNFYNQNSHNIPILSEYYQDLLDFYNQFAKDDITIDYKTIEAFINQFWTFLNKIEGPINQSRNQISDTTFVQNFHRNYGILDLYSNILNFILNQWCNENPSEIINILGIKLSDSKNKYCHSDGKIYSQIHSKINHSKIDWIRLYHNNFGTIFPVYFQNLVNLEFYDETSFYDDILYSLKIHGITEIPELPDEFVLNDQNHFIVRNGKHKPTITTIIVGIIVVITIILLIFQF